MQVNNIFITGKPRSGKSTLVKEVVSGCGIKVAGLRAPEIRRNGKRVGFYLQDIVTGEKGVLAHVDIKEGPRVGKYGVCMEDLEKFTELSLRALPEDAELVVIDEIGKMEMFSENFVQAVDDLLKGDLPVLAVLHRHLVDRYKEYGKVYRLEKGDHEGVKERVLDEIIDLTRSLQDP